jgi:hypothetical protein
MYDCSEPDVMSDSAGCEKSDRCQRHNPVSFYGQSSGRKDVPIIVQAGKIDEEVEY